MAPQGHHRSLRAFACLGVALAQTTAASADGEPSTSPRLHVGVVGGLPQLIGVMLERPTSDHVAWQLHGGTTWDHTAAGVRLAFTAQEGHGPYATAGGGLTDWDTYTGGPRLFGSAGVGWRIAAGRIGFFGEVNRVYTDRGSMRLPLAQRNDGWSWGSSFGIISGPGGPGRPGVRPVPPEGPHPRIDSHASRRGRTRVHAMSGIPYGLGLSLERRVSEKVSIDLHGGTVVLAGSAGARLLYGAQGRGGWYGFSGLGVGYVLGTDVSEGSDGAFPFNWTGVGGRLGGDTVGMRLEAGILLAGDAGSTHVWPAVGLGLSFTP